MSHPHNPPIAYAVVAKGDDNDSAMAIEMDAPNMTQVSGEFQHLPEARNLSWRDSYFEDDDDIVAVFDLDYENMETYYTNLGWIVYGSTILCSGVFWTGCLLGVPCLLRPNVEWHVRSQHVAITRDGIRIVKERRPTCWGMPCTDAGKSSRTIPFDQITDCDIVEPAGNTCLCVVNTLHHVHVDTASSPQNGQHEVTIAGLQNPQAFKKLVWAMKRSALPPPQRTVLDRGLEAAAQNHGSSEDVATLLRDIRDELRQHNDVLKNMRGNEGPPAADLV